MKTRRRAERPEAQDLRLPSIMTGRATSRNNQLHLLGSLIYSELKANVSVKETKGNSLRLVSGEDDWKVTMGDDGSIKLTGFPNNGGLEQFVGKLDERNIEESLIKASQNVVKLVQESLEEEPPPPPIDFPSAEEQQFGAEDVADEPPIEDQEPMVPEEGMGEVPGEMPGEMPPGGAGGMPPPPAPDMGMGMGGGMDMGMGMPPPPMGGPPPMGAPMGGAIPPPPAFPMASTVASALDAIAQEVEDDGLVDLAERLDRVANTISGSSDWMSRESDDRTTNGADSMSGRKAEFPVEDMGTTKGEFGRYDTDALEQTGDEPALDDDQQPTGTGAKQTTRPIGLKDDTDADDVSRPHIREAPEASVVASLQRISSELKDAGNIPLARRVRVIAQEMEDLSYEDLSTAALEESGGEKNTVDSHQDRGHGKLEFFGTAAPTTDQLASREASPRVAAYRVAWNMTDHPTQWTDAHVKVFGKKNAGVLVKGDASLTEGMAIHRVASRLDLKPEWLDARIAHDFYDKPDPIQQPSEIEDANDDAEDQVNPPRVKEGQKEASRKPRQAKKKGKPVNPWAVCNESLGKGRSDAKHERCVKDVKKKHPVRKSNSQKKSARRASTPQTPWQVLKATLSKELRRGGHWNNGQWRLAGSDYGNVIEIVAEVIDRDGIKASTPVIDLALIRDATSRSREAKVEVNDAAITKTSRDFTLGAKQAQVLGRKLAATLEEAAKQLLV